jgi:putative ABC transport system ATP-binding protein
VSGLSLSERAGPDRSAAGNDVHLLGVVHLYRQSGTDIVALRGVDLDVGAGEMVALLGPSGMGKTTVLRLMAGVLTPSAGKVTVGRHDLGRLTVQERRRLRATEIGYMVQGTSANVLPFATAVENVWYAQHGARVNGKVPPWQPMEVLEMLGLGDLGRRPLGQLPAGVQHQVAIAACMSSGPKLLLADEPTAQLSPEASVEVVSLLRKVNTEQGATVVIVTHDPTVAAMFPRTITIRDGRIGSEGRRGQEYAVVDGSGSVQLPPDVLEWLPPNSRVRVVRTAQGVELRPDEDGSESQSTEEDR